MKPSSILLAALAAAALCACSGAGGGTPTAEAVDLYCGTESQEANQAFNDAVTMEDAGKPTEAESLYVKAIGLDPKFCDAMDNLGLLLGSQKRMTEAVDWYKKSLEVYPENTVALQNLGLTYNSLGQTEDALDTFQKLVAVDPESAEGYFGLGLVYRTSKQPQKAIENYKKAEVIYTEEGSDYLADAHYGLGLSYFDMNDCANARKYLEPLYSDGDKDLNYALGTCYATSEPKNLDKARQYIGIAEKLGATIPDDVRQAISAGK